MSRFLAPTLVAALALLASGCGGRDEEATPVACLEGPGPYLAALVSAPGQAQLAGEVPIADCLVENQQGGDLAEVGSAMVSAATKLNGEARADPQGPAALRLGYLLGAVERGAKQTEGIHAELLRRLTMAARYSPEGPLPPSFMREYRRGFVAGR